MISIFRKELNVFFSSLTGYIAITIFLIANGLFCWVFSDTNVFESGFASLDTFFNFAPWVFMFLVPAITMRSFAEEINLGTIELLVTKPLSDLEIIVGKYLASLTLVLFSILPTILYYIAIYKLSSPVGNVDSGGILGSYIGLLLLGAAFVAIGIFASAISSNQIIAFIIGMFACFFLFSALDSFGQLPFMKGGADLILSYVSLNTHYASLSKGVIDTRDVIYFLSMVLFFILCTKTTMESRKW